MDQKKLEIVEQAIAGDTKALEKILEIKSRDILYLSLRFTNKYEYEDAAQEALYSIAKDIRKIKNSEYFDTWVYSAVRNACMNYIRKQSKHDQAPIDYKEEVIGRVEEENVEYLPVEFIEDQEMRKELLAAIEELPEHYKQTILLRYFGSLPHREIAATMDTNVKAVNNNLTRGMQRLKEVIENRSGKTYAYNVVPAGTMSVLTQVLMKDCEEQISTEQCRRLVEQVSHALLQGTTSSIAGRMGFDKGVIAVGTAAAAAGVIFTCSYFTNGVPQKAESVLLPTNQIEQQSDTVPDGFITEVTGEEEREITAIETIQDMLGEEQAEELFRFAAEGVDEAAWKDFLQRNGAVLEGHSVEDDEQEYELYVITKQDKQLLLMHRRNLASEIVEVKYRFEPIQELLLMIEVILLFE